MTDSKVGSYTGGHNVNIRLNPSFSIWITVGQGPTALAVGAGVVWTFLLSSILSFLFLPLFGRRLDID